MPSKVGTRAVVVSGETDAIQMHLVNENGASVAITGGTVTITDHNNTAIESNVAVAVSGSLATYSRAWDAATFPFYPSSDQYGDYTGTRREWRRRVRTYKAVWSLTTAAGVVLRTQNFELVRRRFVSQLDLVSIKARFPSLGGQFADTLIEHWIAEAWAGLELDLWAHFADYPGNLFFPENFREAQQYKVLSMLYLENSFGSTTDEDWIKHKRFGELYQDKYDSAAANVAYDWDDDGILDTDEGEFIATVIEVVR